MSKRSGKGQRKERETRVVGPFAARPPIGPNLVVVAVTEQSPCPAAGQCTEGLFKYCRQRASAL